MAKSLQIHNKLMRMKIGEFDGYEVKTEVILLTLFLPVFKQPFLTSNKGDAFMISFSNPVNAAKWCLAVQVSKSSIK
jgi:hypothetical protein